jgi:F-type H+-transporting ATPase subunit gamma
MSESLASLHRKIEGAGELGSVVRTMKAVAASSISQYERAVQSLTDYFRTVEMGLVAAFRQLGGPQIAESNGPARKVPPLHAVAFGSDQGLVGQFNERLADFVVETLTGIPGEKRIWAVGDRMCGRLEDGGVSPQGLFSVPNSVSAITPLVAQILVKCETVDDKTPMYLFHNRPQSHSLYEPTCQRLLPLDEVWLKGIRQLDWPTKKLPEVVGPADQMLRALISEYLFVSLFKACAESLASENASRLSAMQRAERNIDEMLEGLNQDYHHLRQSSIDEELFDLISGFEALKNHGNRVRLNE